MKKHLFFAIVFLIACNSFKAQPFLEWANSCGSSGEELGQSIAVDVLGNVYTLGTYENVTDFDPGPGTFTLASNGTKNIFIQKLDGLGHFVWAKNISGTQLYCKSMVLDQAGNIYIAGYFNNIVDLDPGVGTFTLGENSSHSSFVEKLDNAGNFVWAKSITKAKASVLTIDASGSLFILGEYADGTVDFDPDAGVYNLSASNKIFILKLNSSGGFIFAKGFGNTVCYPQSIKLDQNNNILITGYFTNTVDFDPGIGIYNLTSNTFNEAIFVLKLNASADFMWVKGIGGDLYEYGFSVSSDNSNNVLITGCFSETVDFDPGPGTYTLATQTVMDIDIFVLKLDAAGNFLWVAGMGGGSIGEAGYAIFCDAADNIYTGGVFDSGNADFDPGPATFNLSSGSGGSSFVQKLDPSGNFIWAVNFSDGENICKAIAVDISQNVYATGYFVHTMELDPPFGLIDITSNGGNDMYVVKLTANNTIGTKENFKNLNVLVYPNPTKDKITISSQENIDEIELRLTSITGVELINENNFNLKNETLDITNLASGVYFLQITSTKQNSVVKIVKD